MSGLEEVEDELLRKEEPETGLRDNAWEHCVTHQISSGKIRVKVHPARVALSPQKPDHRGNLLPGTEG